MYRIWTKSVERCNPYCVNIYTELNYCHKSVQGVRIGAHITFPGLGATAIALFFYRNLLKNVYSAIDLLIYSLPCWRVCHWYWHWRWRSGRRRFWRYDEESEENVCRDIWRHVNNHLSVIIINVMNVNF